MNEVQWCGCMDRKSVRDGVADLFSRKTIGGKRVGEFWELAEVKSFKEFKDEASDISWGVGRILGGLLKKAYVRVPGDQIHYRKVVDRMNQYGCIRSRRFLINGQCPSGAQS